VCKCARRRLPRPPAVGGAASSLYRPRGGSLQSCHTVLITCRGMVHNVVELTVVLANLASGKASWRALYLSRSGFEGGGVGASSLVVVRTPTRGCG
jgi:hypothetical protein